MALARLPPPTQAHDQQLVNLPNLSPIIYANPCFAEALGGNRVFAETPEIIALKLRGQWLARALHASP